MTNYYLLINTHRYRGRTMMHIWLWSQHFDRVSFFTFALVFVSLVSLNCGFNLMENHKVFPVFTSHSFLLLVFYSSDPLWSVILSVCSMSLLAIFNLSSRVGLSLMLLRTWVRLGDRVFLEHTAYICSLQRGNPQRPK